MRKLFDSDENKGKVTSTKTKVQQPMRNSKRFILLVITAFTSILFCNAQSYINRPNDTIVVKGMMEDLETLSIQQVNMSTDTLHLLWEKISASVPPLWEASVCDNKICYTTLQTNGSMNPIYPYDSGFLLMHITAHVNPGTSIIRYAVWDANTPLKKDTLTYILNVFTANIKKTNGETPLIWIAGNKFHLQNTNNNFTSISLMDLSGKLIFKSKINNMNAIELPYLSNALYFIQLNGEQNQFHQKLFYIQQ
jgi:hypothetical protein